MYFEIENCRTLHTEYDLSKVEIKYHNFKIDQPVNNDIKTYENIRKIATGQGDDYTTGCLLEYPYFKVIKWLQ